VPASSRSLLQLLRRGRRRLAGWLRQPELDLVYSELYQIDLPGTDARRGERILSALDAAGLLDRRGVHRAELASFRELRRVHTDDYLDSLSRPAALLQVFGLELPEYAVERALEGQRAMVGGTLLATRLALASGRVAANLGGGLHHAFAAKGERFCIFNDVAVAIAGLRADGFAEPVLVVDLDLHDDDGTRSIFAHDRSVYTFSIHNRTTVEVQADAATAVELGGAVDDATYLEAIESRLPRVFAEVKPRLVYYLAGCDPAADDGLGNWRISAAGMLRRDRRVIELARRRDHRLPVVVLLAGGYGPRAWRYSARFLSTLRRGGRAAEPPSTEEVTLARFRLLSRERFPGDPRRDEPRRPRGARRRGASPRGAAGAPDAADWALTSDDLHAGLSVPQRPRRLLGVWSRQQVELVLERAGLLERLRQLGYHQPTVALDLEHPGGETVQVYGDPDGAELLADLRLRVDRRVAPGFAVLRIEWLRMQNPGGTFSPARPRLPGQEHPGLGMLRDAIALLIVACERLQLDGLLWVPARYHTAVQSRRGGGRFLDPQDEGTYRAVQHALAGLPLPAAAAALEAGNLLDAATGAPFAWRPMPVAVPAGPRLREQLDGGAYELQAAAAAAAHALRLAPAAAVDRPQPPA
jgi:acetoin utilization deacetylase AcuC-like enzyme